MFVRRRAIGPSRMKFDTLKIVVLLRQSIPPAPSMLPSKPILRESPDPVFFKNGKPLPWLGSFFCLPCARIRYPFSLFQKVAPVSSADVVFFFVHAWPHSLLLARMPPPPSGIHPLVEIPFKRLSALPLLRGYLPQESVFLSAVNEWAPRLISIDILFSALRCLLVNLFLILFLRKECPSFLSRSMGSRTPSY